MQGSTAASHNGSAATTQWCGRLGQKAVLPAVVAELPLKLRKFHKSSFIVENPPQELRKFHKPGGIVENPPQERATAIAELQDGRILKRRLHQGNSPR